MGCLVSQVAAKFAFFPPSPATYRVNKGDDGKLVALCATSSTPITYTSLDDDCSTDVLLLDTKRGNKIVAFYMKNPYAKLTLIYSHGNAADLGQLYHIFLHLSSNLRVNLIGYDYSGYGASSGKPSEYNTYADIEAVYECLQTEYGVSQEDIILYGQSVGSGPTLHLAARLPRLRGVVLHSAMLSGLRVLFHVKFTFCLDIYRNVNKIRKVKSPVLVIHGTEDDVVDWLHGDALWKLSRDPYEPLWIEGGGHCDLEMYPEYIQHLYMFIQEMEQMTTKIHLRKIRQTLCLSKSSSSVSSDSTNRCCRIRFMCQSSTSTCVKCFSGLKCLHCQPRFPDCLNCCIIRCPDSLRCCIPRCPKFLKHCVARCPGSLRCSIPRYPKFFKCCIPRCPDSLRCCIPKCPNLLKCCIPRCPDCLRPGFTKCSCSVKCSCWCIKCPCW